MTSTKAPRTVIVTGGTRGIGRAIAELFLRDGERVCMTGRTQQPEWLAAYPLGSFQQLDFLDQESVARACSAFGSMCVDVLVNNAGMIAPERIDSITHDRWNAVLATNLTGSMRLMRTVAIGMKERRQGVILNVSSIAGLIARPGGDSYSASKAALLGLTRAAALDLAPFNVFVNALCPGVTETDMVATTVSKEQQERLRSQCALQRLARPEEIAAAAHFLCSEWNTYMTGQTVIVDGGTVIQ